MRKTLEKNYKNFIFDMDGTLVNSADAVLFYLKAACEQNNAQINYDNFSPNIIGPPLMQIIQNLIIDNKNEELVLKIMGSFRHLYDNNPKDESQMYENTYEWLISLKKAGKKLFLATYKPTKPTVRLVNELNLNMFEAVYTIDMYGEKKLSKSEMISEIIDKYQLQKEQTIMIGDVPSDINSAHEAGIKAAGVLWGYGNHKEELIKLSDYVLEQENTASISSFLIRGQR
jgi:phosphoglycolate phosphatase